MQAVGARWQVLVGGEAEGGGFAPLFVVVFEAVGIGVAVAFGVVEGGEIDGEGVLEILQPDFVGVHHGVLQRGVCVSRAHGGAVHLEVGEGDDGRGGVVFPDLLGVDDE